MPFWLCNFLHIFPRHIRHIISKNKNAHCLKRLKIVQHCLQSYIPACKHFLLKSCEKSAFTQREAYLKPAGLTEFSLAEPSLACEFLWCTTKMCYLLSHRSTLRTKLCRIHTLMSSDNCSQIALQIVLCVYFRVLGY